MTNEIPPDRTSPIQRKPWWTVNSAVAEGILGATIYLLSFFALLLVAVYFAVADWNPKVLLFVAIILGGMFGGLTLALLGGEKLGLKFPGAPSDSEPFEPGFLGDVFVGIMAAMVMFGIGGGVASLSPFKYEASTDDLATLWLRNFALAHLSGFLGLNLIKRLSSQLLDKAAIQSKLEDVDRTKIDTDFLLGLQAMQSGQYAIAESYMRKAMEKEGQTNIRSYIGLAMVYKRTGRWAEAFSNLNTAISMKEIEKLSSRVAKAYFNRACYRSASAEGDTPSENEMKFLIEDLKAAFAIEPDLVRGVGPDPDFDKARKVESFTSFIKESQAGTKA